MEWVTTRLPRSTINKTLSALDEGGTVLFEKSELPKAYQAAPAKLAREFNTKHKRKIRAMTTKAGITFVREYDVMES